MGKNGKAEGWLYALFHFAVEVGCFFWLNSRFGGNEYWFLAAFSYDALAFLPQIYLGALLDRFPKFPAAASGFLLAAAAVADPEPISGMLLLTLGNCLIHVEGAEVTLRSSHGKMGPAGIFVAGGSFGVIVGRLLGNYSPSAGKWIVLGLLFGAAFGAFFAHRAAAAAGPENFTFPACCTFSCDRKELPLGWFLALAFSTVAVRSFVGYTVPNEWMKETWQIILQFVFMGLGKGLGGVLADRFGVGKVSTVSLVAAIPFLCLGRRLMAVSLLGIMLFSMTMATSLGLLVSRLNRNPGIAFGITTTGLFVGTLPSLIGVPASYPVQIVLLTTLSLLTAACFAVLSGDLTKQAFRKGKTAEN